MRRDDCLNYDSGWHFQVKECRQRKRKIQGP